MRADCPVYGRFGIAFGFSMSQHESRAMEYAPSARVGYTSQVINEASPNGHRPSKLYILIILPFHWGDEIDLSSKSRTRSCDHLEWSWVHEIETMEYPAPYGTDAYLFNVYMGSSGDGAPSDAGVAGYYTTDEEGWPMVVLSQYVAENDDQYSVIPHEFFHAVQHSTERYPYSGASAWYWEAT